MVTDLVTFDCYGTLINWREGVRDGLRQHLPEAGAVEENELFAAFAEIENRIEADAYRPYRQVLRETASGLARRFGWDLDLSAADILARSLPTWEPFPDVNPALMRLRALGYRLGILSNIDDDLLESTLRHFRVPFDVLVTAEQTRSYKPAPQHFQRAFEAAGGDRSRILHIAQSHYHDVQAAVPLGIVVVWVNRDRAPLPDGGPEPTAEVRSVGEAVEWLEARRSDHNKG